VIGDPRCCLHQPDGFDFCYAPTVAVLVQPGDGVMTPLCEAHVDGAHKTVRGKCELVRIAEWLAGSYGYRPGPAGGS
jgi:hypothetical protein